MTNLRQVILLSGLIVLLSLISEAADIPSPTLHREASALATERSSRLDAEELMQAAKDDLERSMGDYESPSEVSQLTRAGSNSALTESNQALAADSQTAWKELSLVSNARVQAWEEYFSGRGNGRLRAALDRIAPHRENVEGTLSQLGLPSEMMVVAFVESEFASNAISPKGAAGAWQFMPATATRYGLRQDRWTDERKDIGKSTLAAGRYLADLYEIFGDWLLALAAYNAGEERVADAVAKGKTRDFWTLSRMGLLPAETQDYVPKILGALHAWRGIVPQEASVGPSDEGESASPNLRAWVYASSKEN